MSILDTYRDAITELGIVEDMWNPFQIVYNSADHNINNWAHFMHSMQTIGIYILVLMGALKFTKMFLDELHGMSALTALLGVGVEMALVAVFIFNYTFFAEIFPLLFHRLTRAILVAYDVDMMAQVRTALETVGEEKSSEIKWFSANAWASSIANIISTAMAGIALALYWVMSKYQAILYTFWYLIGPILVPFWLYPPFRGVAEKWFASLLGASFMGVVGAIMFMIMVRMQWLTKAFASGVSSSYTSALVFSVLLVLLMISIPKLSNAIWQGISSSMAQAVAMASMAGGAATAVAMSGAGAAVQVTGSTIRNSAGMAGVLNRYSETAGQGMSASARIRDAITNRDSFRRGGADMTRGERIMAGAYQVGAGVRDFGHNVLMSQMPAPVRSLERALTTSDRVREARRDQGALRDYVAEKVGRDQAAGITIPKDWSVRPGINQSYDEALRRTGDQLVRGIQRAETAQAVRAAAEQLVGAEKAQSLVVPNTFSLKPRKGQTTAQAVTGAAEGLLRKQGLIDDSTQNRMDHDAIKAYAVHKLGAEEAKKVLIPSAWRVMAKRGQSRQQAIEGSATALMQELGLIDRKGQNAISSRYTYAQARKRKSSPTPDSKG